MTTEKEATKVCAPASVVVTSGLGKLHLGVKERPSTGKENDWNDWHFPHSITLDAIMFDPQAPMYTVWRKKEALMYV